MIFTASFHSKSNVFDCFTWNLNLSNFKTLCVRLKSYSLGFVTTIDLGIVRFRCMYNFNVKYIWLCFDFIHNGKRKNVASSVLFRDSFAEPYYQYSSSRNTNNNKKIRDLTTQVKYFDFSISFRILTHVEWRKFIGSLSFSPMLGENSIVFC